MKNKKRHVFSTGDIHGWIDIHKLNEDNFPIPYEELTSDDLLIINGDAAIIWDNDRRDAQLVEWYERCPWTTLFCDGNHEGFARLNQLPETEFLGRFCISCQTR